MRSFDKDLESDQLNAIFNLLDRENTKTIVFNDLNKYYSRINGIPESLSRKYHDEEIESLSDFDGESMDDRSIILIHPE